MATRKRIQQIANSLIGEKPKLPIPIEKLIKSQGISLLPYDMGEDVSGILMVEKDNTTIGYAKDESPQRQRFTMAHELGHFILHREGGLFVDKTFKTMYRPSTGGPSNEWQEWEANEFAACILMPESLVKDEMAKVVMDYDDTGWITALAKKFNVSEIAMSIRITRLSLK